MSPSRVTAPHNMARRRTRYALRQKAFKRWSSCRYRARIHSRNSHAMPDNLRAVWVDSLAVKNPQDFPCGASTPESREVRDNPPAGTAEI